MTRSPYRLWRESSLSARIMAAVSAGILLGVFLGEPAGALQPVADAYIRLMQMTVLPYLVTALILAFGQLEVLEAKRLAVRGGILLVVIWVLSALVIVALPQAFPELTSAEFFSHAMVEPRGIVSFTDVYFTSNLFDALSRNVVPAVVLFSSLMGIGLMGLKDKERLLAPLRTANEAITAVAKFVINLTPIGVFAIGAVAAGTMEPATLQRLMVYFVAFGAAAVLLAGWILPLLVTTVTPFRYGEVAGIARDALLTAFVTGSAFIVLPILIERSKELLDRHGLLNDNSSSAAEVMIPVLFNFPNAGKLLTLLFVPYAGWVSGQQLATADYASLIALGIPSYFAKAQVALPYLLDVFRLPHDLFQLYVPSSIVTGKFDALLTAMNLLVVALLGAGAMGGFLVFERMRLIRAAAAIAAGLAGLVVACSLLFSATIDTSYHLSEALKQMHHLQKQPDTIVHRDPISVGATEPPATLAFLRARGSLRIGYDPNNLPMSFFNSEGELVGFDVQMGEQLAGALGLRAEFVPVQWSELPRLLERRVIDVMPGVWFRPYWFSSVRLSQPYFIATVGLATRDERRDEFAEMQELRRSRGLTIGVPLAVNQIALTMEHYFGGSDAKFVVIDFWKPFFEGKYPEVDAFLMPAEQASGWSLMHPEYSVVVPQPDPMGVPTAFGLARDSEELAVLVDEWVVFAKNSGIVDKAFAYWVQGEGVRVEQPRWSVVRDVLGWVD